jgi:hypothetical protein
MCITILKTKLQGETGKFLVWSSDKSMRSWFLHAFKGTRTPRIYWTFHFLGFVSGGSVRSIW